MASLDGPGGEHMDPKAWARAWGGRELVYGSESEMQEWLSSGFCGSGYQISHVETCGTRRVQGGALVFGAPTTRHPDGIAAGTGLALLDLAGQSIGRPLYGLFLDYPAFADVVVLREALEAPDMALG